jgi:hypothetical protein
VAVIRRCAVFTTVVAITNCRIFNTWRGGHFWRGLGSKITNAVDTISWAIMAVALDSLKYPPIGKWSVPAETRYALRRVRIVDRVARLAGGHQIRHILGSSSAATHHVFKAGSTVMPLWSGLTFFV